MVRMCEKVTYHHKQTIGIIYPNATVTTRTLVTPALKAYYHAVLI